MTLPITIAIILLFLFIISLGFLRGRMNTNQAKGLIFVFLFLIVAFSYFFDPNPFFSWDISRYYIMCDRMSSKNGLYYAFVESEYRLFVIINLFFYFVAQIGNYSLIAAVPMLIDVIVLGYLLFDVITNNNENKDKVYVSQLAFTLFAWLSTINLKMAVASGRCTLAVSIVALALYWEYIKGKKKIASGILYLASFLIHPIFITIILIRLACNIKNKRYFLAVMLSSIVFMEFLVYFLNNYLSFEYANMLGFKLNRYWGIFFVFNKVILSEISIYVCWIMVLIYLIYIIHVVSKNQDVWRDNSSYVSKIINFEKTLVVFSIGISLNYLFLQRVMYLVAFAFLFILPTYLKCRHYKLIDVGMVFILSWLFFLNDLYGLIANYVGGYFLSR